MKTYAEWTTTAKSLWEFLQVGDTLDNDLVENIGATARPIYITDSCVLIEKNPGVYNEKGFSLFHALLWKQTGEIPEIGEWRYVGLRTIESCLPSPKWEGANRE